MSEATYDLNPVEVPLVKSKYRRIRTKIPVPESLPIFQALRDSEPSSMMGQPPVVCIDDPGIRQILSVVSRPVIRYSMTDEGADYCAANMSLTNQGARFDVMH